MQIRIANLNTMTTTRQLAELFLPFGKVLSARIENQGRSTRSQSMGLVQMDNYAGKAAIRKLHWLLFMNSYIEVYEI